jgi:hypothetical protein
MSPVAPWPSREPGTLGVGYALFVNLGVAGLSFALGDHHPRALLVPAGVTALGSAWVGVVLLARPPLRRFGAGVLGGVLFAVVVEFGLLVLYVLLLTGDT